MTEEKEWGNFIVECRSFSGDCYVNVVWEYKKRSKEMVELMQALGAKFGAPGLMGSGDFSFVEGNNAALLFEFGDSNSDAAKFANAAFLALSRDLISGSVERELKVLAGD